MKIEQIDWRKFNKTLNNDLAQFWQDYADYLQQSGLISNARLVLYRAAQMTAQELRKNASTQ